MATPLDDALRDGATVPILYEGRKADWAINEVEIDILFDRWFDDLPDDCADIAGLDIPEERRDELILLIDTIVISWVDQAFGLSAIQLSLSARANYAFAGGGVYANIQKDHKYQIVDLESEGASSTPRSKRDSEP